MKRKIYVCAPLRDNDGKDVERAMAYYKYALKNDCVPVGPHTLAKMLEGVDLSKIRQTGMSLLWFCDEIWVFGDERTDSMQEEILFGRNMKIRMRIIKEKELKK